MEALAQRLPMLSKRHLISAGAIAMSCGITVLMSVLFHGAIQPEMLATGFICAVSIDHVVSRITRHYRTQLAAANRDLERRVQERTAALEAARDELMIRDRMATAGMLAAGVSHEIKSPLAAIMIAAEEIRELGADPDVLAMASDIREGAERINAILRDLTSLARPVEDPLSPIDLRSVVDTASRLASYRFAKGTNLIRRLDAAPLVLGNSARLVQLVLNLIVNAARAARPDAPNTITLDVTPRDKDVILSVTDTGTGMCPATKARLFEPFFTTGAKTGGTGLGLTICKSLVERMGGKIEIESTLGEGTRVEVTLKRADAAN